MRQVTCNMASWIFSNTFSNRFSVELFLCSTIPTHSLLLNVSEIRLNRSTTFFRTRSVTDSPLSWLCVQQFQRTFCYRTCPKSGSNTPRVHPFSDAFGNRFSVKFVVCSSIPAHPLVLNMSEIWFERSRVNLFSGTFSNIISAELVVCSTIPVHLCY